MTLDQLLDTTQKSAQHIFDLEGMIRPLVLMITDRGVEPVVVPPFSSTEEKYQAFHAIRLLLAKVNAHQYASIIEAWYVETPQIEDLNGLPPSQHPDRKEGVFIYVEERGGQNRAALFDIVRPMEGKPHLNPRFLDLRDSQPLNAMANLFGDRVFE